MIASLTIAIDRVADILGRMAAALAAIILALITAHIVLEILLRNLFGTSTFVLDELVGYGVGAMTFLAMAHTFRCGEMIRVHLVLSRLSRGARRAAEIVCALLALAGMTLVTTYFGRSALRNWTEATVSSGLVEVPQWLPETVLLCGLVLLCLQLATYIARLALDRNAVMLASDVTSD